MKHSLITSSAARLGCLLLLFAGVSFLLAQAPKGPASATPPPKKVKGPDTGWVSLFNGKDLTGWVKVGDELWEVVDGAIHGKGITTNYGYLRTEKMYKDFQ